jgi:zinc-binding alcohol dehydrogenase family protein
MRAPAPPHTFRMPSALRPTLKTFRFDQALEALAYAEQGRAKGKVVITLD